MTRAVFALATIVSAVVFGVALAVAVTSDANHSAGVTAIAVLAGAFWIAAGLIALAQRPDNRIGWLMLAAGDVWAIAALQLSENALAFTIGVAFGQLAFGPWVQLMLSFPEGRLHSTLERVLVSASYAALVLVPTLLTLFDPTPLANCDDCPESAFLIASSAGAVSAVGVTGALIGIGLSATFAVLLSRRYRTATAPRRRILAPVYLVSVSGLVAIIATNVALAVSESAGRALGVVAVAFFGAVPIAFLGGLLRTRLARASVAELTAALNAGVPLQSAIATALGDPSIEIVYRLDGRDRWVDEEGRPVPPPHPVPGMATTSVLHGGTSIAAIVHDRTLLDEPGLVDGVAGAAALALRSQGLQAETRAQFAFLETLVNTAPSLLVNIDVEGVIRNQNRAAVDAAGFDSEKDVRGRPFWDVFIDPTERDEVIARFEALKPRFEGAEYVNRFTNARGEARVIAWRSAPVPDEHGDVMSIVAGGLDITDKEREREFLNAIANEAPSLLCLVDETGLIPDGATNRAFERTLGFEPDETGGHVFWERYVPPEEAAEVADVVRRTMAGEDLGARDSTWLTKDGRRRSISWSCTRLPAIDERRLGLVSGVDVTERRARELELERERDATTTVLQTISSVIAVLARDFSIRDRDADNPLAAVNRAFHESLHWRDEDLVARDFLELVAEEDRDAARRTLAAAAAGAPSATLESEWLSASGVRVPFEWNAAPVADVTGRTDGLILVSGVDITQRRRRELEAARRRAFIDAVGDAIPSLVVIVDTDGKVRREGVNRAFCETFGWSSDELVGRSFLGSVVDERDHEARRAIANAADGGVHGEIESPWRRRDGSERTVAWTTRPVPDLTGGNVVLISGSDVTLRREQAEELRASRARIVSAADEARRRLERNLHDGAQQRLVALAVSLRLAESKLTTDPDVVQTILAGARDELAQALDELRELARGIHPAVLTDRGLVAAIDALVSRSPVPVETEITIGRLEPATEAAAYYVVSEALANVAKYAEAKSAHVLVSSDDDAVTVVVADDGAGGAEPAGGSGLRGLADRVAALDGTLSVHSPPGGGTRVCAVIPVGVAGSAEVGLPVPPDAGRPD